MQKINLLEKFNLFNEYWSPHVIGEFNNQYIKLAKFKGEFIWHNHKDEDELFLVIKGTLKIELKDQVIFLNEGEFYIVPKGVEHKPSADEDALIMLIEPKSTTQTGGIDSILLATNQPWI